MPIVFSEDLIKSSEQIEAGWTQFKFLNYKESSKDGKINYYFEFDALASIGANADINKGRKFTHVIFGNSLSGEKKIQSVIENLLKMTAALMNVPLDEVKTLRGEIDYSKLTDRVIWINISDFVKDGKIYKQANEFLPGDVNPEF